LEGESKKRKTLELTTLLAGPPDVIKHGGQVQSCLEGGKTGLWQVDARLMVLEPSGGSPDEWSLKRLREQEQPEVMRGDGPQPERGTTRKNVRLFMEPARGTGGQIGRKLGKKE